MTQVVEAKQLARRQRLLQAANELDDALRVGRACRETTRLVISGMAALRVSPQSRTKLGPAATAHAASPGESKPWKWRPDIVSPEPSHGEDKPA